MRRFANKKSGILLIIYCSEVGVLDNRSIDCLKRSSICSDGLSKETCSTFLSWDLSTFFIISLKNLASGGIRSVCAVPVRPALPVLPIL